MSALTVGRSTEERSWAPWLPQHWEVRRLKYIASVQSSNVDKKAQEGEEPVRLCNYADVYHNDRITSDLAFMEATATSAEIRKFTIRAGDVIVTKDSESPEDIAVPAYVSDDLDGVLCGYHLALLRPKQDVVDGRFLFYCLVSRDLNRQFRVSANGITRFGLTLGVLGGAQFPIPPLDEQRAIADYLDEKTAAIDALIAKRERQVQLLDVKRKAIITERLALGLEEAARIQSEQQWLGSVPEHWSVIRLKNALRSIEQGWSPSCENRPANEDEWGVMRAGCVNGADFDQDDNKALPADVEPLTRYEIRAGDVLMSRANTRALLGSAVYVQDVRPRLLLCDKLYRLSPRPEALDSEFLAYALSTAPARYQFERDATGSSASMQNIGQSTVMNLVLPLPPLSEQHAIVEALRRKLQAVEQARRALNSSINKLREYRQTLISAAVAGQIPVREEIPA